MQPVLLVVFVFCAMSSFLSVATADTSVALWQGDKQGVVSMTFDEVDDTDGVLGSQYDNAFPLLQGHGLKATFFVFSDDLDESAVLTLVDDGQEIGSQGITDTSLLTLSSFLQQYQLSTSQSDLQDTLEVAGYDPNVAIFAYPYGAYDAGVITNTERYYIAARTEDTASPTALNASSPSMYELAVIAPNDNGTGDSNVIGYLQDSVDGAVAENKWAIEVFHDVNTPSGYDNVSSEAFGAHVDYLAANEPNVWVAPMGTVSEYIYERDAASITTLFQDSSMMQLDLQCGLDSRFNTPLTLLTDYPLDWDYGEILVTQPDQTDQIAAVISTESGWSIMYDAMPEPSGGTIELSVTPLEPIEFTVTASADSNGSIDPGGDVTAVWNSDQTFTAITDPNYLVDQWFVDGVAVQSGGSTYTLTNIRADHTVHVTFKPLTTVALWQGNKQGAVSMTFDDGLKSQFNNAFPLLQEHGLEATFFIVVEYFGYGDYIDEPNIVDLAADGQEIGSHGYSHEKLTDLWNDPNTRWQVDAQLSISQSTLQGLSGQDVAILAYPYGAGWNDLNIVNLVDDYYIAARTTNAWANNSSSPNLYTLDIIGPNDGGKGDPNVIPYLKGWVDDAVADNEWVIEMFHAINDSGGYDNVSNEALGAHMDYLVANEPNVWTAPMGTVSEYIYERDAASIITLISDSNMIRLDLQCGLDSRFDTPLTLLTLCPDGWDSGVIIVKQSSTEQIADVVSIDGTLYMLYNAIPDAGTIELSPVFEISGHILSPAGAPLPAVTVTADNGGESLTDPNGYFQMSFGNEWIGVVTPSKQDYTFDPGSYVDVVAGAELNYMGIHIADLFADGVIDEHDLEILCANWLATVPNSADIYEDGQVNLKDFSILAEHWLDEY
jgi:peptidoglycan/xylan/chitin deacetylase (PgdA/CDA1 family)